MSLKDWAKDTNYPSGIHVSNKNWMDVASLQSAICVSPGGESAQEGGGGGEEAGGVIE